MRPSLIAVDVDGTLLRTDETASDRTRAVLAAVEKAGIAVVLVTGRPPRWLAPVLAQTGQLGAVVCANGAVTYDVRRREVLNAHPLDVECLREVATRIRRALPDAAFAAEYGDRFVHESAYVPRWDVGLPEVRIVRPEAVLSEPAVKLLVRHRSLSPDALWQIGRTAVGDIAVVTHGSGEPRLEISAIGVTKATGLASIAAGLGIGARHVAAFGDMPNDLPMMAWAGRSYAVASGHPEVLAIADEIVPSNDEDGVARTLERWL